MFFPQHIEYRQVATSHVSDIKKSRYYPYLNLFDLTIHKT